MLFCEVFLSHELFCPEADMNRPLFELGQINPWANEWSTESLWQIHQGSGGQLVEHGCPAGHGWCYTGFGFSRKIQL